MADTPIRMTRAEYEARYGAPAVPSAPGVSMTADAFDIMRERQEASVSPKPIQMTRAEYEAKYGQPRTWGDTATNLGQSLARGLSGLVGMLDTATPTGFSRKLTDQMFSVPQEVREVTDPGLALDAQRRALIGDPNYSNASTVERYAGAGVEALPFAILGGGPAAAFLSGVGAEAAQDAGVNPLVGALAGGMAPSAVKRTAGALTKPFTQSGQQKIAGEILQQAAGKEGTKRVLSATDDVLAGKTFGEVAQTPGAANLQIQIGKEIGDEGGNALHAVLANRQGGRVSAMSDLADDAFQGITKDVRGQQVRAGGAPMVKEAKRAVEEAWKAVGKTGQRIRVADVGDEILGAYEKFNTPLGFSPRARKVIGALLGPDGKIKPSLTIDEWQKIRSAAGEVVTEAAGKGWNQEAALMMSVRESLDDVAEQLAKSESMQGAKMRLVQRAIGVTRREKQVFETGIIDQMFQKGEGGFRLAESHIPQKITGSPEGAKAFMKAFGRDPAMVRQGRAALLDDMANKGPDTWVKYFRDKTPQFKALFGRDFKTVKRVIDDLASEQSVGQLAQKATGRGSITTQALTTAKWIAANPALAMTRLVGKNVIGSGIGAGLGGLAGNVPGAVAGSVTGSWASALAQRSDRAIKSLLVQALADPNLARALMRPVSESSLAQLTTLIAQSSAIGLDQQSKEGSKGQTASILPSQAGSQTVPIAPSLREVKAGPQQGQIAPKAGTVAPDTQSGLLPELEDQTRGGGIYPSPNPPSSSDLTQSGKLPISYTPQKIKEMTASYPPIVKAVIRAESNFRHDAVSPKGAKGLMQLMPEIQKAFGVEDPFDPMQNLQGGLALLQEEFNRYEDPRIALAAYNAGSPKVERAIKKAKNSSWAAIRPHLPKETQQYVTKVLGYYREYSRV